MNQKASINMSTLMCCSTVGFYRISSFAYLYGSGPGVDFTLGWDRPIREAKNGLVTYSIGWIPVKRKNWHLDIFIWSGLGGVGVTKNLIH